jgi:phosphate transport system substrate-binding protein
MKKILTLTCSLLASATLLQAEQLVIKGSDTLGAKLVPQLAEAFKASHPGVSFKIAAEGSSTGIAALINKSTDIAMSSRRVKPTEMAEAASRGVTMKPMVVAYDGIAVIVNAGNPIKALGKKQIEQIFTGEVKDWSAVGGTPGPISIYTRNTASGTYADFSEMAMKKRNYAGGAQKMAGNEQIASEVGKNQNGIGYVGMAYTKAAGVRPVAVEGVMPSAATVRAKSYAFSRPTFYYTNGEPSGAAKEFLDFTVSSAGQKIAEQVGFAPIR